LIKKLPLLLGLLLCFTIKAQQYKVIDSLLNDYNIDGARAIISKTSYKDSSEKLLDNAQYYVFTNQLDSAFINLFNVDTLSLSPINKARYLDYLGKTHIADDDIDKGYLYSIRAKEQYLKVKELYDANAFNLTLYNLFADQEYYNYEPDQLLELFGEQAIENEWNDQVADYYIQIALLNFNYDNKKEVMQNLDLALEYLKDDNYALERARIFAIKSVYYAQITQELDSADYYIEKADVIEKRFNIPYKTYYTLINKAAITRLRGNYKETINLLKQAETLKHNLYKKSNLKFLYSLLANDYEDQENYKTSLEYLKKHINYRDSVNIADQFVNLTKYQTVQKDKQILLEQQQKTKNKNLAIIFGGFLIAVSIIGLLVYKNTNRKKKIAEQQSELEKQKLQTFLKEQELTTIDAIIEGQEKERQKLAGDLHDSVGATLATARLQFSHLKKHKNSLDNLDDIFSNTEELLSQAYHEIRNMSHLKNSGVLAKKSLVPAIENLAKNASVSTSLQVEVNHYGLEDRLDNNLEISIFRIIQELVTNIIKHANASEASITLTQHDDDLNIIVEDNGKGFNLSAIDKQGLGLSSIEKRVNFLHGDINIDSTVGKGTTIIIDIPLKTNAS
jgi:signal transduction histidine kinase